MACDLAAVGPLDRIAGLERYRGSVDDSLEGSDRVDFDVTIDAALELLPAVFRDQLGSVAITVEDEPTADQLASVGAYGLFGLYEGVPRTRWGAEGAAVPSRITLFADPLARAHPDPTDLENAIVETLYHEIAHHFGIDDARLLELHRHR
jgi:predicted Zn-dependent protease with MMP-like domain